MANGGLALEGAAERPGAIDAAAPREERLRAIVDAHCEFVWRSLRRLGVSVGEVDDGVQQVFLTFSRKLEAVRPGSERSFLFQTALRVAADSRRGRRRRREVGDLGDDAIDPAPTADDLLDLRRARVWLDRILDAMSLDLRAVFVLHELDELTMAEIAILIGLPAGTVASRLRRARTEFREHLGRLMLQGNVPGGER